jgi:hypothetical protein
MTERRKPRPRDPLQLAKLIGDIATGQRSDPMKEVARPREKSKKEEDDAYPTKISPGCGQE